MDDVKRHVEIIRRCGNSKDGSACPECPFNLLDDEKDPCVNQLFRKSADLIESLAAELEQVRDERNGLSIKLTVAESAVKTYKRERDAAIADMERLQGLICQVCKEYYQPDPEIREYSCKVYGEYFGEIVEDGLLCCSKFKWRGLQE